MATRARNAIYECGYCGAQFGTAKDCQDHKKECKKEYEQEHAKCRKCGHWYHKDELGAHYIGCQGTGE
ncbi:MAG: hypothetical protein QNJ44_02540 [Rhodobacter sp.]|nr:hypothetical protein [Rhodobacter sp.]